MFGQNYQLTSSNVCDLLFGLQLVRTGSDVTARVTMYKSIMIRCKQCPDPS